MNIDFETAYLNAGGKASDLEKEDGAYVSSKAQMGWEMWQVSKAQSVAEGFVLIKNNSKTIVAIEKMVEQQVEASGMDSRRLERLDGWKIIEAAVKAQEPDGLLQCNRIRDCKPIRLNRD